MSNAAVQQNSSTIPGRGFLQTFKDSFFWSSTSPSISKVSDRAEEVASPDVNRRSSSEAQSVAVGVPSGSVVQRYQQGSGEVPLSPSPKDPSLVKIKSRNKIFKKKETVSSSTAVPRVEICTGKKCSAKGADQLLKRFESECNGKVEVGYTTCMKACKKGMNVRVTKDGTNFDMHNEVDLEGCNQVICKHFPEW